VRAWTSGGRMGRGTGVVIRARESVTSVLVMGWTFRCVIIRPLALSTYCFAGMYPDI
jgi:hypothetical protein